MEKESRGSTVKILTCLFVAAFLQTAVVQQVPQSLGQWLGRIDWLLLVTVYVGLQRDPVKSLLTGTAAGIVHDLFSGGRAIGVSGFAYVVAAYITYRIATFIVMDNLLVRILAVAAASVVNTGIRLIFYGLLQIELPVLAGGRTIGAALVFGLLANLFASVLLYTPLDRIFKMDARMRMRRTEARRRRLQ